MNNLARLVVCATAAASLGGCAEFTHLTRSRTLEPGGTQARTVFIDAKQRAVYATPLAETTTTYGWNPQTKQYDTASAKQTTGVRICAEPSPDAMSAIAASQGLDLTSRDDLSLAHAMSLAESAGSIGLRTQSIQLMRDAMYRICEGYASGALTPGSYETLHRRLQSSMVAILAIEQLTGAVRARQLVLGGSSGAGSSDVGDLTTKNEKALAELRAKQDEHKAATGAYDKKKGEYEAAREAAEAADATSEDGKTKTATAERLKKELKQHEQAVADLDTAVKDRAAAHRRADEARRAALAGVTRAAAGGEFSVDNGKNLDAATATAVAGSVETIVNGALGLQFSNELCTTVLTGLAYREVEGVSTVVTECHALLKTTGQRHGAEAKLITDVATYIASHPELTPDQVIALIAAARGGKPPPTIMVQ